jgi:SAM-dependent methyltransferase
VNGAGGWHDPATARWYCAFERRHGRYRHASQALARHAALAPGLRVLDLAAGTGATAVALLPALGEPPRLDCVEPSEAMREAGQARLGARTGLRWLASLDAAEAAYDRIVCSAAIWQWPDLREVLHELAARLAPGGALVFNIPAAYLGEPDGPGGGSDPWLTELPLRLGAAGGPPAPAAALPTAAQVDRWLGQAGLQVQRWRQQQRLSQAAWRDWHKIPVITDARWPGLDPGERARRIDAAAVGLDMASWRPERWLGWTAWRAPCPIEPLAAGDVLRQCMPRAPLRRLRALAMAAAREQGLVDKKGRWCGGPSAAAHELPRWLAWQQHVAALPEFHALAESPALLAALHSRLGCDLLPHQGSVCRLAPPAHEVPPTPPHRDADYLADARGVWNVWLPLEALALHEGGLLLQAPNGEGWCGAALELGDALVFSAERSHRAHPNQRLRQPRLSIDFRFRALA